MLPLIWTPQAREDLREIVSYIARRNPSAARRMRQVLEHSVLPLREHPLMYPQSRRMPNCREIVAHPNYLVFYRVADNHIEIVNVVHGRRNFPLSA